jgi:hypothetical protein
MKNFIVYYRVSTKKQEKTRLGLGAQKIAVERFVAAEKGQILAEFTEVETGKDASRPKLAEACRHAVAAGRAMRDAGQSLEQVAAWLNREGYRTTRNSCFTRATVCRALARTTGMALAPQVTQAA